MSWISLHQHSQYSILDATTSIQGLCQKAKEMQMVATALTDHGNLFGAVDFYKQSLAVGVQPILGCEVYVAPHSRKDKKKTAKNKNAYHLILLVKNQQGYHNLCKLVSLGFLEGFYYVPRIDKELLEHYAEGLICLSGCLGSEVAQSALHQPEELAQTVAWYRDLFKEDYYLELQRHPMEQEDVNAMGESWLVCAYEEYIAHQNLVNQRLVEIGSHYGVPIVATNDSHYLEKGDWEAHEILLNIQSGDAIVHRTERGDVPNPKRRTYSSRAFYCKTPEAMKALFHDLPEAIDTTHAIAKKCQFTMNFTTRHYPVYTSQEMEGRDAYDYLQHLCQRGLSQRYTEEALGFVQEKYPNRNPQEVVEERLAYELKIIRDKELVDYLLIVWDFIHWAKEHHIPVGPGRGSGAGSVVLYLIGITNIEPLRFCLFFERFINPEREAYPDIDVDICMARRNEVIDYTVRKYGAECVAQIITFGTMKAKMSIKDVGRVLGFSFARLNTLAKVLGDELGVTLDGALEHNQEFIHIYHNDPESRRIIDLGRKLEGSIRNTGIHAAGIIISAHPLINEIPLCISKDAEMMVTQYAMKPVEMVGMLKIDFLGLKTLTSIQICVDTLAKQDQKSIDWHHLTLTDSPTFSLLQKGSTVGVFQLESTGMRELAKQLRPDRFEEIIAIGALYRPGPMNMIPSYIARKHGMEEIVYDHPDMEPILAETYGIMVYQEQVMHIAQQFGGYSLGEGDLLRKAMGKKDAKQMEKERVRFCERASHYLSQDVAETIFDKIAKFASYGFNKSHAAAYGYLTYVTAYLKAHYPQHWMAALLTCDRDDLAKVFKLICEAKNIGIAILPPDINESEGVFVAKEKGIRFALSAIKGIGEAVVTAIVQERERRGVFTSLYDFIHRMDLQKIGKKTIECLIDSGCFDGTTWSRDQLKISLETLYTLIDREQKEHVAGVLSLFSNKGKNPFPTPPVCETPSRKEDVLAKEKELLGFFLTGHPLDEYETILKELGCLSPSAFAQVSLPCVVRIGFLIEEITIKTIAKKQNKFAVMRISNKENFYEVIVWPELYAERSASLQVNKVLYGILSGEIREKQQRWIVQWCQEIQQMNTNALEAAEHLYEKLSSQLQQGERMQTSQDKETMVIRVPWRKVHLSDIIHLKNSLLRHVGGDPIEVHFIDQDQIEKIKLTQYKVNKQGIIEALQNTLFEVV